MKAYVVDRSTDLGVALREVAEPTPSAGTAVVEVHASSLNRGELLHVAKYRLLPDGTIAGWDLAGVVIHAATDGSGPAAGTSVFGWSDTRGAWAERVAVGVDNLAPAPPLLAMDDGATLGVAGLTAAAAIARAGCLLVGAHVMVTGATGGVGHFAIQLAQLSGARVTAVVRPSATDDELSGLLRDGVGVERGIDPNGAPADLIVESVGGDVLSAALKRVAIGGVVVTLGRTTDADSVLPAGWFQRHAQVHGLRFSLDYGTAGSVAATLSRLAGLVVSGELSPGITAVGGREELPELARAVLDRRMRGKAVVRWASDPT